MDTRFWQDADKRRAFLLSLVLHLALLLLLVWYLALPKPVPLESFLVVDVGEPQLAEEVTQAPAADAPAPQSAEPQVEADEVGAPVAASPEPAPAAPSAEAELEPETEAQAPASEPEAVAEPAETQPEAQPQPQAAAPPLPAPAVPASPPLETELPREELSATTLPEIDEPEVAPQPLVQSLPIPQPAPEAAVTPARAVAVTPSAAVAPREAIPQPPVEASVAEAEPVPVPPVTSEVASPQAIPAPQPSAQVAEAEPVPTPQPSAQVSAARPVPQPQVSAQVAPARAVPTPSVSAEVAAAQSVPTPSVGASVASGQPVAVTPQASVAPGRAVAVAPQASVAAVRAIPSPQVSAAVAPASQSGAGSAAETLPDTPRADTAAAGQSLRVTPGGNASAPGQTTAQEGADAANLGLAAGPEGSPEPTGAPQARVPYAETLAQPLAVMIDNALGYPQAGLLEASMIVEMPVEGGLTRLMTVYDRAGGEPARVGPVRSAREYFFELVSGMNGVLVHDGGSPGALAAIARAELPTINAYTSGSLFSRSGERSAPYNLYSRGGELRQTMRQLGQNAQRAVSGTIFRPDEEAEAASTINLRFSGAYSSAFRYLRDLNSYRWVRNGQDAVDGGGQAVRVDAVLVAQVEARPIPDDPEGRLYLPLRGGPATLYLRGRAVTGRWEPQGGVRFVSSLGEVIDLSPFKIWVAFVPSGAAVTVE